LEVKLKCGQLTSLAVPGVVLNRQRLDQAGLAFADFADKDQEGQTVVVEEARCPFVQFCVCGDRFVHGVLSVRLETLRHEPLRVRPINYFAAKPG
jgi:hypothetical protein